MLDKGQPRRVSLNLGFGEKYRAWGTQVVASIVAVPYSERKGKIWG